MKLFDFQNKLDLRSLVANLPPIQNSLQYLVGQNSLAHSAACLNAKKASFRGWLTALSGSVSTNCW
ncbi:hypothetical protein [Nostoc sp.]|uniref:hypothetical protein n=1 Tax=Nostoc sp. TaxID=1180 RepID=UPI002FF7C08A